MFWQRQILGAITLAAVVLGGFYLWRWAGGDQALPGPRVTLRFSDAAGLRPGSAVRFRGVEVGEVDSITLSPDHASVLVVCRIDPGVHSAVRSNSRFWVVRPQFRGLSEGATGLDTLIRDPYLSFMTPDPPGPPLENNVILAGLLSAPDPKEDPNLAGAVEPGDLEFTVIFTENQGLRAGDYVKHRGMPVGSIDSVSLADAGVEVRARIRRQYRATVQVGSQFWIARPELAAGWRGVRIHELGGIVEGAHLAYHSPHGTSNAPATDGHIFWGESGRPDLDWSEQNGSKTRSPAVEADHPLRNAVARVHYAFSELDTWSPNDHYHFEVPGLVWIGAEGEAFVVVAAPALDGADRVEDAVGAPEISDETWKVELADGSVVEAERAWSGDRLALLRLASPPRNTTPPPLVFESILAGPAEALGLDRDGQWQRVETSITRDGRLVDSVFVFSLVCGPSGALGFVLRQADVVSLAEIPEEYRPRG